MKNITITRDDCENAANCYLIEWRDGIKAGSYEFELDFMADLSLANVEREIAKRGI